MQWRVHETLEPEPRGHAAGLLGDAEARFIHQLSRRGRIVADGPRGRVVRPMPRPDMSDGRISFTGHRRANEQIAIDCKIERAADTRVRKRAMLEIECE